MTEDSVPVDLNITNTTQQETESEPKMNGTENPDSWKAQKALVWQAMPVIILLITSVVIKNIFPILLFLAMVVTFDCVNDHVIRQSELSRASFSSKTVLIILYLVGCLCLTYPTIKAHWVFHFHDFRTEFWTVKASFWSTIFLTIVIDFLCKYMTMCVKCLLLLMSGRLIPIKFRGRIHMTCEGISQTFRLVLPIPQWISYIIYSDMCVSRILCWCLAVMYLILKVRSIKDKVVLITNPWKYDMVSGAQMQAAIADDVKEGGRFCPICHKSHNIPVHLPCGHFFCQDCISLWFDREQHCPRCSSVCIASLVLGLQSTIMPLTQYTCSNSKWKTGATDYVIQFF